MRYTESKIMNDESYTTIGIAVFLVFLIALIGLFYVIVSGGN